MDLVPSRRDLHDRLFGAGVPDRGWEADLNPLTLLKIAPWALAAIFAIAGFGGYEIERGNYQTEKAGRIADAKAAQDVADKAIADAKATSDADLAALNAKLADQSASSVQYVDRIVKVPVTTACAQSPAMKDASEAVRALVTGK